MGVIDTAREPVATSPRAAGRLPVVLGAAGVVAAGAVAAVPAGGAMRVAGLVLAAVWVLAAEAARRADRCALTDLTALLGVAHVAATVLPALIPLVLAGWLAFGITLPDGRTSSRPRTLIPVAGALAAGAWTVQLFLRGAFADPVWLGVAALPIAAATAVAAAAACHDAGPAPRRVLQWVSAGAVLTVAATAVLLALHLLLGAPDGVLAWVVASCALVPLGLAAGLIPASAPAAPSALVEAVVVAGLTVLVAGVYLVVVVGLGRPPADSERDLLASSIVAALVVAVLALPARARLVTLASAVVHGDPGRADEVASFGARMTRAVPMDELLLQLAESLRAGVAPAGAEVWVGTDGVLDRAVAVPDRPAARLILGEQERVVVGRARCGGARWMSVWLAETLAEHVERHGPDAPVRAVPVAHLGALLGLLVVHRDVGADPFSDEDERDMVELARQLGLALHNVNLDSALQASLDELRRRNAELQASRARIVTAGDESRRAIERNLHDGAQQHLVALAVKIGLARAVLEANPTAVPALLEQLRGDAQNAIGALRELAHGIYPPLLRDRGLGEALRTAATRSPLPCAVEVDLPGRFDQEVETCVYFCCLEAVQNAGKHAGAAAEILVAVDLDEGALRFRVTDTGTGFDAATAGAGHGFVNMRDRLGAVGGTLEVTSGPGGSGVVGHIPAPSTPA